MRVYTNPDVSEDELDYCRHLANSDGIEGYIRCDEGPNMEDFMREEEEAKEREREVKRTTRNRVIAVALAGALFFGGMFGLERLRRRKYYGEDGLPLRIAQNDYANGYEEPFSRCYEYAVVNGEAVRMYKTDCIYFLVNNETKEIGEYVFFNAMDYGNKTIGIELFDLNTEELLVFEKQIPDIFEDRFESQVYYDYLINNFSWIPLTKAPNYIDGGMEVKDSYTKEEIEEIKNQVLRGYKIINGGVSLTKRLV
jgi:hypothetical protein